VKNYLTLKTLAKTMVPISLLIVLGGCAVSDTGGDGDQTPAAPTTFNYSPLTFKVKLSYTATFTYTPRDRSDAADYVIDEFERRLESDGNAGNGYQIAQGEQPDLYVTITVNSDDSNNKSMQVQVSGASSNVPSGTSDDGKSYPYTFTLNTQATYRDPDAMIDDIADQMNQYVSGQWWKKVNE
jgi:hypothetical protein